MRDQVRILWLHSTALMRKCDGTFFELTEYGRIAFILALVFFSVPTHFNIRLCLSLRPYVVWYVGNVQFNKSVYRATLVVSGPMLKKAQSVTDGSTIQPIFQRV